nr:serine/threonine protein kinase [Pirellulaceae bacterium]
AACLPGNRGCDVYEFLAIGPGIKQTWRRRLPSQVVIRLGRAPQNGWAVPWDMRISREHADLVLEGGALRVRRLLSARNAIYFHGEPAEEFTVGPGEDFRIGQTVFRLDAVSPEGVDVPRHPSPPVESRPTSWSDFPAGSDRARLQRILAHLNQDDTRLESQADAPPTDQPAIFATHHDLDGKAWGLYELTDQLHRGPTGQVLKARHVYLDRWSAIQILASSNSAEEALARFQRKLVLTASFDQENLIRIYEGGRIGDLHYLIMEYIDGCTLAKLLLRQRLDVATAVGYLIQAARALTHAHQRQTVHRDVNPAHLMLSRQGVIKVIGWGKAWRPGPNSVAIYEGAGRVLGTAGFMAPEQFVNSCQVDERTDVYGLGCTLYALLASQALLPPDWRTEGTAEQAGTNAPPLKSVRPEVPDSLEAVYQKMLAHAPQDRWASMPQVIEALERTV